MSNRGYGIFINHPGEVELEVGTAKVSRLGISVADESLEYFIISGDTPLQVRSTRSPHNDKLFLLNEKILERYTLMTGRPASVNLLLA